MKPKKLATTFLLFTLVLTLVIVAIPLVPKVKADITPGHYGVAYSSAGWSYAESNTTLQLDFGRFDASNIRLICPWLHWSKIETSRGVYSTTFLNNLRRVCQVADDYNIDVDIDFHSGAGASKTYGLPSWFTSMGYDFDDVATNATIKGWFIDMEEYAVTYLDVEPNIRSFHLMNEWYATIASGLQDEYTTLIQDLHDAIEPLTTRPLSYRQGPNALMGSAARWVDSATLWSVCDFMSMNIYIGMGWAGHTIANLDTWVAACVSHSKNMTISEYGYDSADDAVQNASIAAQITNFKARGIEYTEICQYGRLVSTPYYEILNPDETVRPAYYEVEKANAVVSTGTSTWFGTKGEYTSAADVDDAVRGCKFTVTNGSGYATDISVYMKSNDSYTGHGKAAIYSASYGLVGTTDELDIVALGTSFIWVNFTFSIEPMLTNNTVYIIAAITETIGNQAIYVGRTTTGAAVNQSMRQTVTYASGFPDPYVPSTLADYITSMWCNYTVYETGLYYNLNMTSATGGTTIPEGGVQSYLNGTTVYLFAYPTSGYSFAAWNIDGTNETTTETEWYVVMSANHTATAYFNPSPTPPYEYYNTGDDDTSYALGGDYWFAQTFTVNAAHTVSSVKLKLYRVNSPGIVTVSIRATNGSGHPTGLDLTSGTISGNTLTIDTDGLWYEITVTEHTLSASTKYAIVVRALGGDWDNWLGWKCDIDSPTYDGGNWENSEDGGVSWTSYTDTDFMFEVWGNPVSPTIEEFQAPSTVYANDYFFLNATINDAGGVADFVNTTIEISNNVILKWVNSTNTFSIFYDPNSYSSIYPDRCSRTTVNASAYRLSWNIRLNESYPEGSVNIVVNNTKVYDADDDYGSNSQTGLFFLTYRQVAPPSGSTGPGGVSPPPPPPYIPPVELPKVPGAEFNYGIMILVGVVGVAVVVGVAGRGKRSTQDQWQRKLKSNVDLGKKWRKKTRRK